MAQGAGVESDTTTQAANLSNRGLGFLVASCPGLEVRRSMGGPLGTKGMPGWGHNGEKSGKLGVQSSPGAEKLGWALRNPPAVSSVHVGQEGWISASGRGCWDWDWGWKHQLGLELVRRGPWVAVSWGAALKGLLCCTWQLADWEKVALPRAVSGEWQAWTAGPQFLGQASCHATGSAFCNDGAGGGGSGCA